MPILGQEKKSSVSSFEEEGMNNMVETCRAPTCRGVSPEETEVYTNTLDEVDDNFVEDWA